jgi:hypothetical protein
MVVLIDTSSLARHATRTAVQSRPHTCDSVNAAVLDAVEQNSMHALKQQHLVRHMTRSSNCLSLQSNMAVRVRAEHVSHGWAHFTGSAGRWASCLMQNRHTLHSSVITPAHGCGGSHLAPSHAYGNLAPPDGAAEALATADLARFGSHPCNAVLQCPVVCQQ